MLANDLRWMVSYPLTPTILYSLTNQAHSCTVNLSLNVHNNYLQSELVRQDCSDYRANFLSPNNYILTVSYTVKYA